MSAALTAFVTKRILGAVIALAKIGVKELSTTTTLALRPGWSALA
jgi:hypothetical protein